ncbi:MAG: carbohydrate-binding protein [Paludibacteraceae bacterium]|nr:carbohydrate-binding protein [Paludibacteraceae bacterium]
MKYNHILTLLLGCFFSNANAIDFHVSPNGNDAAEGTLTAPFKTLEQAQRAVRGVNKSMKEDINVYLHEGTYQLTSTLRLSNADGGTNGHYVRYMAAPGETPLVTGGIPVNGWELFDAEKNIWCAKDVVGRFRQLYVNGKKAIRARHPNVKPNGDHYFNRLAKVDTTGRAFDVYTDQIKQLENIKKSEIHVMVAWADQTLRIDDVKYNGNTCKIIPQDPERTRLFRRAYPMLGTAFMSNPPKQQCYYLENDMSLLDMEGEWYLDEDTNTLYYMPRDGEDMSTANVVAPNIETLIEVKGESTKDKVQNISFSGIVFAHTNYLRPSNEGFLNLQAGQFAVNVVEDWRGLLKSNEFMLWHPSAGIEVTNASRVIFEDNIFTQMAATGLDFTSGTNDTRIEGNVFTEIGGSSISVGKFAPDSLTEIHKGYNPSDKDEICTRDTVKNNYVHNTTNEIQGGVPILGGYPRYIVIEHNEVSYANYSGISVGFGWTTNETAMDGNKINYNEIHHIARLLCDGAAIYTLSNQGKNGQIMYNYSHDINGSDWADYWTCPIYQDEGTSGFEIAYNVAVNAPKGTACNACGQNYAHDNDGFDQKVVDNAGIEAKYKSIKQKDIPLPNFSEAIPQEPYSVAFTLPGKIEMEDYDLGGQGIAYYDKDVENQGESYRNEGVDIVTVDSISESKGYAIGYTQEGEWTEYSIVTKKSAPYFYKAHVASGLDFSSFILMVDGKQVADTVKIPQTDNWNTYTMVDGKTSTIEAGEHILRVRISGAYANIDWIAFADTKEELDDLTGNIDILSDEPMEATVVDMMGKNLAKIVVKGSVDMTEKLKTIGLKSGVYAIRFNNGKSQLVIMK